VASNDVGFNGAAISCGDVGDADDLEMHPYGVQELQVAISISGLDETVSQKTVSISE
jgi:hypothetical protein